MMNREETSRACKAGKLMWALEAHGRRVGLDLNTVAGVNDLNELAGCLGAQHWATLAKVAHTLHPGPDTIRLVRMLLKAKASFLFDQPAEKSMPYSERPSRVEVLP